MKKMRKGGASGVFIGVLFLLIGISILLKVFFHIHFPVFRTLLAIFVIYLGIKMLIGTSFDFRYSGDWEGKDDKGQPVKSNFKSIASGTAVRFEPGQTRTVRLIAYEGDRKVYGFQGKVMGALK